MIYWHHSLFSCWTPMFGSLRSFGWVTASDIYNSCVFSKTYSIYIWVWSQQSSNLVSIALRWSVLRIGSLRKVPGQYPLERLHHSKQCVTLLPPLLLLLPLLPLLLMPYAATTSQSISGSNSQLHSCRVCWFQYNIFYIIPQLCLCAFLFRPVWLMLNQCLSREEIISSRRNISWFSY